MIDGRAMLEVLRDFVQKAKKLGMEYMVTGSFAMSAYGEIRFTRDIDIVIAISTANVEIFARQFEGEYYIDVGSIRRAVERGSMFNIIHNFHGAKIDCIVRRQSDFEIRKFENRRLATVGDLCFSIITKEDLILSKLEWARDTMSEMQIRDIAHLISNEYDADYVGRWIERLGLVNVWKEVMKWKTQHPK